MKASARIKKVLREMGYKDVRVNTVAVKCPLVQIWIPYESSSVFANDVRKAAVCAIYSVDNIDEMAIRDTENIDYGNIQPKRISMRERELENFIERLGKI